MAIFSLNISSVSRGSGRSAVATAAYIAGKNLVNERDGRRHNYTSKSGVIHSEIVLPKGADIKFRDRAFLWNAAETQEKLANSRVGRMVIAALPHELSRQAMIDLSRDFAQSLSKEYGVAVDFSIHEPDKEGDQRNFHVHFLMTTRIIKGGELTKKSNLELRNAVLKELNQPTTHEQFKDIRKEWANFCNLSLSREKIDARIYAESFKERGIDLIPAIKLGAVATALIRKGKQSWREGQLRRVKKTNAKKIVQMQGAVLKVLTDEKKIFTERDLINCVERFTGGIGSSIDEQGHWKLVDKVLTSDEVVEIGQRRGEKVYTTRPTL